MPELVISSASSRHRARLRWYKAYTLVRNPALVKASQSTVSETTPLEYRSSKSTEANATFTIHDLFLFLLPLPGWRGERWIRIGRGWRILVRGKPLHRFVNLVL